MLSKNISDDSIRQILEIIVWANEIISISLDISFVPIRVENLFVENLN